MSEWFLVIYIYAGMLAKGDSVALVSVPMATHQLCLKAAEESSKLSENSSKITRTVCLKSQEGK
jgi:hypothetical protein